MNKLDNIDMLIESRISYTKMSPEKTIEKSYTTRKTVVVRKFLCMLMLQVRTRFNNRVHENCMIFLLINSPFANTWFPWLTPTFVIYSYVHKYLHCWEVQTGLSCHSWYVVHACFTQINTYFYLYILSSLNSYMILLKT